jgi:branched-chain amino acid aminotransferase
LAAGLTPFSLKYQQVHRHLLHNADIRDTTEALIMPGQVGFMNGWGVFSTLRVADGILFAFDRHYRRIQADAERMHVAFDFAEEQLESLLLSLVEANQAHNATLRVAIVRNHGGLFEAPNLSRKTDLIAFTADLSHWGKGVKLSYKANARHGASPFAGAKVTSWAQNLTWYEEAHELGFDEFVLLNEEGQVSECTSANIFAVLDDQVLTPPLGTSGCLPGVTRAVLLEEINVLGLTIREEELTPSDLENADQVFITSTTRDLLPVLEIDQQALPQTPAVFGALRDAFLAYQRAYISSRQADIVAA